MLDVTGNDTKFFVCLIRQPREKKKSLGTRQFLDMPLLNNEYFVLSGMDNNHKEVIKEATSEICIRGMTPIIFK